MELEWKDFRSKKKKFGLQSASESTPPRETPKKKTDQTEREGELAQANKKTTNANELDSQGWCYDHTLANKNTPLVLPNTTYSHYNFRHHRCHRLLQVLQFNATLSQKTQQKNQIDRTKENMSEQERVKNHTNHPNIEKLRLASSQESHRVRNNANRNEAENAR